MFDQRYFSVVYQSWIFKNETICLCREKQLTFSLLQLLSGSEKRTSWLAPWVSQAHCTSTLAIIPAPGCCKELLLDWLLLFVAGDWLLSPLLPCGFVLVLGLFALRSFLSSKHALLYHRGFTLQAASCGEQQPKERESSPSLPPRKYC